jgi:transcriptional regulator with XRE-family HTH domain
MPIRHFTASSYVAAQVRNVRKRRRWSQQQLSDRLSALLTGPPPEIFEEGDPRRRQAETRRTLPRKWTQTRIAKLERGALKCVSVDDVLELALALDVSPLVLMTPALQPESDELGEKWTLLRPQTEDTFKVAIGNLSWGPRDVRQWIRGVRPLLNRLAYRTDDEAQAGMRFYLLESQPLGEWGLIREAGEYAVQVRESLAFLSPKEQEEK